MRYKTILNAKLLAVFLFLLALTSSSLSAQSRHLTGNISDENGGIPGASVVLKGTTNGTVTDDSGNFALDINATNPVLVVSFVGYATQEIIVGDQTALTVKLESDASALSEVVVTGYGSDANRRQSNGAVSTIKARDLKAIPSGNVEQQLQGRVSGVTVITNGQPGTTSIVRVRGFGAFGGNEPLYVVDGVPVGSTDFLAPDDIETTTILKDAAAASIYGARAANGVIVYTTKRGTKKSKRLEVSYDGLYGATDPGKGPDVMNTADFMQWTWQAAHNDAAANGTTLDLKPVAHPQFGTFTESNKGTIPDYINVGGAGGVKGTVDLTAAQAKYNVDPTKGAIYQVVKAGNTDWYGAITRTAPLQRHNLGFSGGSENSRFYIGLGTYNQAGILKNNDFSRYDFRANSEYDLTSKLRIGENLQFTYRSQLGSPNGQNGRGVSADENDFNQSYRMPNIIPIYDEFGGYAGTAAKGFNNPRNPVATIDGRKNDNNFNGNAFGNIYAEYDLLPGLMLRSTVGGQYNNYYYKYYSRLQYENSENNASYGFGEGSGYNFQWNFTNTAEYKKKFGQHDFTVLGGVEALNTGAGRSIDGSGINPFSTDPSYINLNTVGTKNPVSSNFYDGVNFYSVFGRLNYSFADKYYLTGVLRRDGSSRFGINSRYGVFPAFSAQWRVTGEDFMKNQSFITDLKIRAGWGQMGNSNNVDPNNQYSLYGGSIGSSAYDLNGTNTSVLNGFYRTRIGNPDAKWETSTTTNFGFDATILGSFDIILDVWNKDTKDLLYQVPLPAGAGIGATPPSVNIANMNNNGIDLQLIKKGKFSTDWKYEVNVTGSVLSNKIVSLAPDANVTYFDGPNYRGVTPVRNIVGQSISNFYGYQVVGLFQSKAEADASKQDGAAAGRFKYADINGDGKIDAMDRTNIGSPVPKFTGGLYFNLNFKGLEIATYLYTSLGNKIYNFSKWYSDFYPSFAGAQISNRVKNSWSPTNTGATTPIFESYSGFSSNTQSNSFYVEDGSYLRMQNLAINYNLPNDILKPLGIKRAKIGVSTNNVFTITGYQGLDPAVGGAVDTNFGVDIGNYPVTRSYLLNVSVGF